MKMKRFVSILAMLVLTAATLGILLGVYFVTAGVSARAQPGSLETFAAHTVRNIAIRTRVRGLTNPVPRHRRGDRRRAGPFRRSLRHLPRQ